MTDRQGHILVVDDNRMNRLKLSHGLRLQGYTVSLAANGQQALEMACAQPFDLMLLDIMMPEMNGYQVLAHMKGDDALRDVPIIVISALDEMSGIVKCIEMGAEDYLPKPFDPVLLRARIGASLEKKHLRDQEQAYLKQLQTERERLRQYTIELQARNEELDAFAHTVAHDLKTPLSAVFGYADMLETMCTSLPDNKLREYLHIIAQNGRKMTNIIDELLLLASVRKMTDIKLKPLQMGRIVSEAQSRLEYLIEKQQVKMLTPDAWPTVMSYAPWVEEVWVNYLSNAIKYGGRPPYVELGATIQTDRMVSFWVRDNGLGLDSEAQARLFTPFTRLAQVQVEGHGLGLSIVQRIVEKLGGQVGVKSQVGQGSTFSFTLPATET